MKGWREFSTRRLPPFLAPSGARVIFHSTRCTLQAPEVTCSRSAPDLFLTFRSIADPRITWPNGERLALWIIPNAETYPLNEPVPDGTGLAPDVINWHLASGAMF